MNLRKCSLCGNLENVHHFFCTKCGAKTELIEETEIQVTYRTLNKSVQRKTEDNTADTTTFGADDSIEEINYSVHYAMQSKDDKDHASSAQVSPEKEQTYINFSCPICGEMLFYLEESLAREETTCPYCYSSFKPEIQ